MKAKKIPAIVGALAGIIIVATVTATVLSLIFLKDQPQEESATTTLSAEEIIKEIKKDGTVPELSASYRESSTPVTGQEGINYTKKYLLTIPALNFAQFEQKDTAAANNNTVALEGVSSFLARKGLEKLTSSQTTQTLYTLFDSEETTCQILSLPKMNDRAATLTVSCVKKEAITTAFKEVDDHLALYSEVTSKTVDPTTIKPVSFSEGNKKLTTLNVYESQDKAISLLFVSVDGSWEYLGERPLSAGTTEANPNGLNRSLSPELKQKISNPKYEGFLQKYIL